jgi:hypothetical protein
VTFKLPENISTGPIATLGAGILGSRIALMAATRGAEVRLYARSAATRDAGVAFAREHLPAVLGTLPGSKAGTIVGFDNLAARSQGCVARRGVGSGRTRTEEGHFQEDRRALRARCHPSQQFLILFVERLRRQRDEPRAPVEHAFPDAAGHHSGRIDVLRPRPIRR